MSLIPVRMKKIQLKMKALECSQDFSHYKCMEIFPDAQGQLTLQTMVGSGQISNSSKILWLSSLPAKMKKIQSQMKALECSQHYASIFSDAQGQITLELVVVSGRNVYTSKLSCMSSFVTCKNEDDRIKNEGARVFTRFLPLSVYGDFSRCPRAANSAVLGPIWLNFELVRDVMDVLVTCKYEEDPIKN